MNKTITTKHELLELLAIYGNELNTLSENALNNPEFLGWMKTTGISEEEVHSETWWYSYKITRSEPADAPCPYIITIETSIVYDAFSYNGNDEDYYDLAATIHSIACSKEMYDHFNDLDCKDFGCNWSTLFDVMVYILKGELCLLSSESRLPLEITMLNPEDSDYIDPDDFFSSI